MAKRSNITLLNIFAENNTATIHFDWDAAFAEVSDSETSYETTFVITADVRTGLLNFAAISLLEVYADRISSSTCPRHFAKMPQ